MRYPELSYVMDCISSDEDFNSEAWQSTDKPCRCIIHIDIDCFYAQVEMINNPKLKEKPLGIQQKNIIVTCNYKARERGLTKLMYLKEAKEKCPDLILVNGENLEKYRDMSNKIFDVIQKFSPVVEKLGLDENFIDVTSMCSVTPWKNMRHLQPQGFVIGDSGSASLLTIGSHIAAEIRSTLYEELGITSCAGISFNKLLAKLVGSVNKPNKQTVLYPGCQVQFMNERGNVRQIPGIGSSTCKRLATLGISTVSDLNQSMSLEKEFDPVLAKQIKELAQGIDDTPVIKSGKQQSMSDEDSFRCCDSLIDAKDRIQTITSSLIKRVIDDGRIPQTLRLSVRKFDPNRKYFGRESRQCPIPSTVFTTNGEDKVSKRLLPLVMDLFKKIINVKQPFHLTLINVCFTKFLDTSCYRSGGIKAFFKPQDDQEGEQGDVMDLAEDDDIMENKIESEMSEETCTGLNTDVNPMLHFAGNGSFFRHKSNNMTSTDKHNDFPLAVCSSSNNHELPSTDKNNDFHPAVRSSSNNHELPSTDKNNDFHLSVPSSSNNQELPSTEKNNDFHPAVRSSSNNHELPATDKHNNFPSAINSSSNTPIFPSCNSCPQGIDREVFMQLPSPIQKEILTQHTAKQVQKEFQEMKAKQSPSKRKSGRNQTNISLYFKKKT